MAYTIYNNDGTVLSTIAVGDVDTFSTSLDLIGKNVNNYGEYYNTNLVRLLTSFAAPRDEEPRSPQTGQLWYNTTEKQLQVFDAGFKSIGGAIVSGTPPISATTGTTGTIWFNTIDSQLKVWDGRRFNLIGPATSGLLGQFGILPPPGPIRDGIAPNPVKVSLINSYGNYAGLIADESFVMTASSSTVYLAGTPYENRPKFTVKGVTLFQDLEVLGRIFVKGEKVQTSVMLSAYFDITPYGTYTATMTTSSFTSSNTNLISYNDANRAISNRLATMFDRVSTDEGTKASVICTYNTETSVRQFILTKQYTQQNVPWWEPLNNFRYLFTATSTTTNTIDQVRWLWEQDVYTNIALPAWKEAVRTDSTSTFSNSDLTTITVGTPFFIKITGGVPFSQFSYTAAVPPIAAIPAGNRLLDGYGDYTFTATTVTLVDQLATSTNYSMNFTFNATNSSTQLRFTASQPIP